MGDFDEKAAMEVVKESMGMTDEDFAPQDDLDLGDGDESSDDNSDSGEQPRDRSFDSHDDDEPVRRDVPQRERRETPQAKQDPLRQNTLRFDPRAQFRQDAKGNLIDTKSGEIIARAGSEARIYQRVHKQASDYIRAATGNIQNTLSSERQKLDRAVEIGLGFERELSELKQFVGQVNAHELDRGELLEAAGLFKQAKSDPVGVLKNLLTRAALSGIDITQLGLEGNTFDAKSMMDMFKKEINSSIEPVRKFTTEAQQAREARETQSQYLKQAERQVNDFFGRTPAAVPFTHIFHAVLTQPQFQHMSLGEIWDKVQLHLIRNGIDPSQAPSRSQRQRLSGTPTGRPSRSPPNGQGMAPSGGDMGGRPNSGPAHPSMSYDAIIREVLGSGRR
jgi:hypothetical protein